jgi:acetyl-CoA C-acetyltransferase
MQAEPVYIAGAFEHPTREAPEKGTMQLHAEVAFGALTDAGVEKADVDGLFTAHKVYLPPLTIADYLGLNPRYFDTTDSGGSSYIGHLGHAVSAVRQGKCDVALITQAGRPRSNPAEFGAGVQDSKQVQDHFEGVYGASTISLYALAAKRHMHEFGTTREQLSTIRTAAAHHAQYNENALYQEPVSIDDVANSRLIADPLRVMDCCVVSDGGGALVVVSADVRDSLDRECVEILGHGEAIKHQNAGRVDITSTAATESGRRAYDEAGIKPDDIDYASVYDSFTITVIETLEDLGFCKKGAGGEFVEGGTLRAPDGELPINTDGGGLCSNHPGNRGGMVKLIEAVRQLRGEAHNPVQVDAETALVHGLGGVISTRHASITAILGREDR